MRVPVQQGVQIRIGYDVRGVPPQSVEYGYFAYLLYLLVGTAWGLSVPMLGGVGLAMLVGLCIANAGSRWTIVYAPILYALACAISYVALQLIVHGEPVMAGSVRTFIDWIQALIIVQALAMRPGFLHRFALAAFGMGLCVLPFMQTAEHASNSEYQRMGAAQGVYLSNANGLAAWFGFCAVYFIIVAIEHRHNALRLASGLAAVGCLYVVGLTVSRGALLAIGVATLIALSRIFKRGVLAVSLLAILGLASYASGVFDRMETFYAARATEETGRLVVWPYVLERFVSSPLVGVGESNAVTYVVGRGDITPHNSFLFIAVASGIVPLLFYATYWWQVGRSALRAYIARTIDSAYFFPLVVYAFLLSHTTNLLMEPWLTVTLCSAMAVGAPRRVLRVMVPQGRRATTAEGARLWSGAGQVQGRRMLSRLPIGRRLRPS
jgi:hypothetical protein